MISESALTKTAPFDLPPYLPAIRDYLRVEERETWGWFASRRVTPEHAKRTRFELLKSAYRLDRLDHEELYELASLAAESLELDAPITLYQGEQPLGLGAALAFDPGEAHILVQGPLKERLTSEETLAVFGHELSHFRLLRQEAGEFLIVQQLLDAFASDREATPSYVESARLFRLYAEIYCDRGGRRAAGQTDAIISALIKIDTGVEQVNVAGYLRQAAEVFAIAERERSAREKSAREESNRGKTAHDKSNGDENRLVATATGISHPENFIRAHAIDLYARKGVESEATIARVIEGAPPLGGLDLLGRARLRATTRRLLQAIMAPSWFRTEPSLAHARLYQSDFDPAQPPRDADDLREELALAHDTTRDFACFVLLDFASVDRDLEELPLAHTLHLAERWGLETRYAEIVRRELRLRKGQIDKLQAEKDAMLERASAPSVASRG